MKTNGSNLEEIQTSTKYKRMSAHKAQKVINQICGCSYEQAFIYWNLYLTERCHPILQLFFFTIANASRNSNLNKTNLIINETRVDGGTTLKRFQPRAQGRAYPVQKPTCHITITVKNG